MISVNGAESLPDDGLPMGAEATTEALLMAEEAPIEAAEVRATDEDDIGMEMDYDNLMAYFESLKESTAWFFSSLRPFTGFHFVAQNDLFEIFVLSIGLFALAI